MLNFLDFESFDLESSISSFKDIQKNFIEGIDNIIKDMKIYGDLEEERQMFEAIKIVFNDSCDKIVTILTKYGESIEDRERNDKNDSIG